MRKERFFTVCWYQFYEMSTLLNTFRLHHFIVKKFKVIKCVFKKVVFVEYL